MPYTAQIHSEAGLNDDVWDVAETWWLCPVAVNILWFIRIIHMDPEAFYELTKNVIAYYNVCMNEY